MRQRTWLPAKPKPPPRPKVDASLREAIDAQLAPVVAKLRKRICDKPRTSVFNRPEDLFTRWHRDALYFVLVLRTPHGRPPTFETHVAKMEYAGDGKFNLAVPMRRGWNTFLRQGTTAECLKELIEVVHF